MSHRFDWPVVARLHHELYAELAELRLTTNQSPDLMVQHPLVLILSATSLLLLRRLSVTTPSFVFPSPFMK